MPLDSTPTIEKFAHQISVLELAIKIWSDPKKRTIGAMEHNGAFCALGVLAFAQQKLYPLSEWVGVRQLLGLPPNVVAHINDNVVGGQKYLYDHMKDCLTDFNKAQRKYNEIMDQ